MPRASRWIVTIRHDFISIQYAAHTNRNSELLPKGVNELYAWKKLKTTSETTSEETKIAEAD